MKNCIEAQKSMKKRPQVLLPYRGLHEIFLNSTVIPNKHNVE
ncbi:hypothetical protein FTV88_1344 [Heliorestis convoluta]|uniref:Uncharacterized protein n=1 Tax=Heliorestis convoluta TaxID=356322 RepID=A0A5Q2MZM8_9FIRM|nr:hypothetical protein FTV88_1344 [Heliorestis convoluta]